MTILEQIEQMTAIADLKAMADHHEIAYPGNVSKEVLREMLVASISQAEEEKANKKEEIDIHTLDLGSISDKHKRAHYAKLKFMALVRVKVFPNYPQQENSKGEIFTVSNKYVPPVRFFVPWGDIDTPPTHLPRIVVNMLKEAKASMVIPTVQAKGTKDVLEYTQKLYPRFRVEEFLPLTDEERAELALKQKVKA